MNAILILGAAVWADGPSPTLLRRTLHAAQLWHRMPDALVVPCGGLGRHAPTEARMMRDLLEDLGVSPKRIVEEDRSHDTLSNLTLALPILRDNRIDRVVIVTDRYHARRALMVARHLGLHATADCPLPSGSLWRGRLRPGLREWLALPVYRLRLARQR